MSKKSKILSILIVLSLILPLFAPMAEVVNASRAQYDDIQTFSLPIVDEDNISDYGAINLSLSEDDFVGDYNFKGDIVQVYIRRETKYPIFGRVPIIIRLTSQEYDTFENIDYTVTLKDGINEIISKDLVFENSGGWGNIKHILAYFPDTITAGDYEISLEVADRSGSWDNAIELDKNNLTEETEGIEETEEIEEIEKTEETEELEDVIKEEEEENIGEAEELPILPIEDPIDTPIMDPAESVQNNLGLEPITADVEPMENIEEPIDASEESIEETTDEVEKIIEQIIETTESTINTGYRPIRLSYEEIIEDNKIVIDKANPYLYLRNLGKNGNVEAKILNNQGNTVYITNSRLSYERDLYEYDYYMNPFYNEYYKVYSGSIEMFKTDETTIGQHTFILSLDGQQIYTKEINIVNKQTTINYVQLDKYLLAGDREFKIRLNADYLTKKDLIDIEVVDSDNNLIASSIGSHYINMNNNGEYMNLLYNMEVEEGSSIVDNEYYTVQITYRGPEQIIVHPKNTTIRTTTWTSVSGADTSLSNEGKIILEGVNFKEDVEYIAEVSYEGQQLGEFFIDYIDSRTLSLNFGSALMPGSYNINVYSIVNYGDYTSREYIGNTYFYIEDDGVTIGDPALIGTNIKFISPSQSSYKAIIEIGNFIQEEGPIPDYNEMEVSLVDKEGNEVGKGSVGGFWYSNRNAGVDFIMNITTPPMEKGEYHYIFKYQGNEIKDKDGNRIGIKVTDEPRVNDLEIKGSIKNYLVGIDKDIDFTLMNGLNINDLTKIDLYIGGVLGEKIATLDKGTLVEEELSNGTKNYTGKMKFAQGDIASGHKILIVLYDNKIILEREINVITEPFTENVWRDSTISANETNYNLTLNRVLNINIEELSIKIFDLLGNEIDTTVENIREWNEYPESSGMKNIDIALAINGSLKDAYYELDIRHGNTNLLDNVGYYQKGFYATNKKILTGLSISTTFENDDIRMNITKITEVSNNISGENYKGYFYLRGINYEDLEFVGSVDLISGEFHTYSGILFPSEKFIDYPVGRYEVFIEKADGELFGRSYFNIGYKDYKKVNPDIPTEREPSFNINGGADYTNDKEINLNINPDGYTLLKIANTLEDLAIAESISVESSMKWTLLEGEGSKTIYAQFFDDEDKSSEVISKTIILDTIKPTLSDVMVNYQTEGPIEDIIIGHGINIQAKTNERGRAYATFYKDGEEISKNHLRYNGKNDDSYMYDNYIYLDKEIDLIIVHLEDLAGNRSEEKVFKINMVSAVTLSGTLFKEDWKAVSHHGVHLLRKVGDYYEGFRWTSTDRYGDYDFGSIPVGEYKLVSYGPRGYKDIEKEIVLQNNSSENLTFEPISYKQKNLTVLVKDGSGQVVKDIDISVYGYKAGIYEGKPTDVSGIATFSSLPAGEDMEYNIYLYTNGYSESRTVTLTENMEVEFTVPSMKTLTGKATVGENEPVSGAEIMLMGGNQYYYTNTDDEGNYSLAVRDNIEYNLTVRHPLYTSIEQTIASNITEYNIKLSDKIKVFGTLRGPSGETLSNVDIYASGNNDWQRARTDGDGNYEIKLGMGQYTISHGWVQGYISKYENIGITDLNSKEVNITLEAVNNYNALSGEGNNVKADAATIQRGKTVNIVANYKNNSYRAISGKLKIELPEGIGLVAGETEKTIKNLERGKSGQLLLTVEVLENYRGSKIVIPGKATVDAKEYTIGFAEIDVIDITLTAPELVPEGNFKVYGETTPGANVVIMDKSTNKVLATSKTSGRWYSVDVKGLADGEYEIFAKAEKDGNIAISQSVNVKVDPHNGVKVTAIEVTTSGGQKVGTNHEIGVPAFTAWTDLKLNGKDIDISVELSKHVDSVKFIFAGKEYVALENLGRWETTLAGWSGSGTKQIIIEITIGSITIRLVVGEVIILIDPSGYVYDEITGERIEGATVTCDIWDGISWKIWDAELYGQINPQITDANGEYGWMVPAGIFRVRVDMEGYESKVAGNDMSIIIPPPRTDVNIGLISLTKIYDETVKTGFYVNRNIGNQFIDIYHLLNDKTKHLNTMTSVGLENVLFVHQNGTGTTLQDILDNGMGSLRPLIEDDFEAGYKDMGNGITIKPTLGLKLTTIKVENGKITAYFDGVGEAPTADDFTILRLINEEAGENVEILSIDWDAGAKKAILNIDSIDKTDIVQLIEYFVTYQNQPKQYGYILVEAN